MRPELKADETIDKGNGVRMHGFGGFRHGWRAALLLGLMGLSGCGAAYYGAAAGIFASQKKSKTIDESFPDAVLTDGAVPRFATLRLSSSEVTVPRTVGNATIQVTGFEVLGVDFPPGYGASASNRDAETSLLDGDRLVIRINGDVSQALVFGPTDVASVGSAVAATIQARVRALTPTLSSVPAEAYTLFTGTFDPTTRSYRFRSGAPGETSEVLFEPARRPNQSSDQEPDEVSTATAERLGLGEASGGIETSGAETIGVTVLNRGTDVVPSGTRIALYLSHDKVLDAPDLLFDTILTDETIAVGEARRFFRRNGAVPPAQLVRQDFTAERYFVLFDVGAADDSGQGNNLLVSTNPVEVYQPFDDPATPAVEAADALDFVIQGTASPISVVTGRGFNTVVTVTNVGAAVGVGGVPIDIDVALSSDATFDSLASISDPANVVAGVRINPTDLDRPVDIMIDDQGTGPIAATVAAIASGNLITVKYDGAAVGADVATVQSLTDALNGVVGSLLDAFPDGNGAPATDTLNALRTAAGFTNTSQVTAADLFVSTRRVTFAQVDRPLATQSFAVGGIIRTTALQAFLMPRKAFPVFRIRPQGSGQNTKNDVRLGANYVRVYDAARATFDPQTGALLPTVSSDDFAELDAVGSRPVNTGSLRQGQQRVFSFELPSTGLAIEEAQLLVILQAAGFDAHVDLLNNQGEFLMGSDDSPLGADPIIYTAAQASSQSRVFYLVVAPARVDESDLAGSEALALTISVNSRKPGELALVSAVDAGSVVRPTKQRYEPGAPRSENDVLVPFSLSQGSAEVLFVLPQRARLKLRTRPVFQVGVQTIITAFVQGVGAAPVEHQRELDETADSVVLKPNGGTILSTHTLERGVYTIAIDGLGNQPDFQRLRLELETEFIPGDFQLPN